MTAASKIYVWRDSDKGCALPGGLARSVSAGRDVAHVAASPLPYRTGSPHVACALCGHTVSAHPNEATQFDEIPKIGFTQFGGNIPQIRVLPQIGVKYPQKRGKPPQRGGLPSLWLKIDSAAPRIFVTTLPGSSKTPKTAKNPLCVHLFSRVPILVPPKNTPQNTLPNTPKNGLCVHLYFGGSPQTPKKQHSATASVFVGGFWGTPQNPKNPPKTPQKPPKP